MPEQQIEEKIDIRSIGNILEGAGFTKRISPLTNNKPEYLKNNQRVLVCVPCGWIKINDGGLVRAMDINKSMIDNILKDAHS